MCPAIGTQLSRGAYCCCCYCYYYYYYHYYYYYYLLTKKESPTGQEEFSILFTSRRGQGRGP